MATLENKKIFLIATGSDKLNAALEGILGANFKNLSIYTASDGIDAQFKIENVVPHLVIMSCQIPKVNAVSLTEKLIARKERMAVIILAPEENKEHFMDEVVTGQVQYLTNANNSNMLVNHVSRSLNWLAHSEEALYRIKFLSPDEMLIKDGEEGKFVYIVRSGKLKASKTQDGTETLLGYIEAGEFVGEMAYINGELRSANVTSITATELIEIPSHSLDSILFSKPSWSKALMKTLSRRLKVSNTKQTPEN
ncbi:MAG: cyclic nucleotide-binding domain-containing protein [Bdellovibrionota bacterium]